MSKVQMLRALVKQRLTAAAEEIFGLFERTIAEYEEELSRSKEENERQRKLLDAVFSPQLRLHRADVQQLVEVKEEFPPKQQEWSSSLDQEDPEPPHIKEEQEELWTSQEGEQLQGLEEADITKFTFTPLPVKSEDDEEKPQSSQLHQRLTEQMETEADGEDCGGPEPARNPDPDTRPEADTHDTGHFSVAEIEVSFNDWKETREPQSGLHSLNNDEVPISDERCSSGEKPFSCSECDKGFDFKGELKVHMRSHTGEKHFNCSVFGKQFTQKKHLTCHMVHDTGGKRFRCSECDERFGFKGNLKTHMRTHTGEKFSCSVCSKAFSDSSVLKRHMRFHVGEKLFSCSVCKKSFTRRGSLQEHMRIHTTQKPFNCSVCDQRFTWAPQLKQHLKKHKKKSSQCHQTQTEENREAEPPASSSTEPMETEADGEDCRGPEPARNSDPDRLPEPDTDDKTGDSSEPEYSVDIEFWNNTRQHQPGFTYRRNKKVSANDGYNTGEKPFSCSDDKAETELKTGDSVDDDLSQQTRQPQSSPNHLNAEEVSVSDTGFNTDMKPFSSSEDGHTLLTHQKSPTGEKPFGGSVCGQTFAQHESLCSHVTCHTGEKPFHCSVCNSSFSDSESLVEHMRIHTRQTQFSCQICGEEFAWRRYLTKHMEVHSKEKTYSCNVCDQIFAWYHQFKYHKCFRRPSSVP